MANCINDGAYCWVVQNNIEKPSATVLCECSLCCQGYNCLHLFCIAGNRNEVETDQKHKPCKFITWGWQRLRQTRCPQAPRWWWPYWGGQRISNLSQQGEGGGWGCDCDAWQTWTSCRKPATDHCERNGRDFPQTGFQSVVQKLLDDQGMVSSWTLASLSDEDITTICNVIRRPGA